MPDIEHDLNLFDEINTLAARWLVWNSKERKKPLGIKGFKRKNVTHMWLLHIMASFSVAAGYQDVYLDCSWIDYLYIRFIKKFHYIKKMNKKVDAFLIEPELFAKEVCSNFNCSEDIVKYIYDEYWR